MTTDKHHLRALMRVERKRLAGLDPAAPTRLADHAEVALGGVLKAADGPVVALYRARGSEIDTEALAHVLVARGARLVLPVVTDLQGPLEFRRWTPGDPLEPDLAGVPAPLLLTEAVTPDVVFIPLLAFDTSGGRLGQGGGFYDRTLQALRRLDPRPRFIGLAYAGQRLESLPSEDHDQPLDGVLTEAGYLASSGISR